jgi:hypothetical protein
MSKSLKRMITAYEDKAIASLKLWKMYDQEDEKIANQYFINAQYYLGIADFISKFNRKPTQDERLRIRKSTKVSANMQLDFEKEIEDMDLDTSIENRKK